MTDSVMFEGTSPVCAGNLFDELKEVVPAHHLEGVYREVLKLLLMLIEMSKSGIPRETLQDLEDSAAVLYEMLAASSWLLLLVGKQLKFMLVVDVVKLSEDEFEVVLL